MANRTTLIHADEWLLHQVGRPMAEAAVSDHRLYGRHWFSGFAADGEFAMLLGMGVYKNLNVTDGFISIQHGQRQYNLRASRVWRPNTGEMRVGPILIEVIKPFEHLRLTVDENEHGISGVVDFMSEHSPHLEKHHLTVVDGAITTDMTRYDQAGVMSGWLKVDGKRVDFNDWWSVRDHSWGVRPGVGGWQPQRGDHSVPEAERAADPMKIYLWSHYSNDEYSCQFQQMEDASGNILYMDGHLYYKDGRPDLRVVKFEHDITYFPDTVAVERLHYMLTLSDGSTIEIHGEPAVRAWAYNGTGYDNGYWDGKGLGAQRGNMAPEYDVYDLGHPELVRDAKGEIIPPGHREQPVKLTANGKPCFGHFPVMHV